jgi:solute carrier family 25 citrate transporter 1
MIEDSKREVPRFKGTMHGIKTIVAEEGYRGVYRGLGPVVCLPLAHEES